MFETERLIIRKFTPDDLDKLIELRSADDVIKYIGGRKMQNAESIAARLQFYIDCYEKYGYGMCAMLWKETGEMFGWSGLQPLRETGETELGYGMIEGFWGRGVGFECAMAWLKYGFEKGGATRIVAVADPANTGSWRIMEKCGMTYEKTGIYYESSCVYYAITKEEFEK